MNLDFEISKYSEQIITWLTVNGIDLLMALLILLVGTWIARRVGNMTQGTLEKRAVDILIARFVGNVLFYALLATVTIAALGQLGINTTSFVAIVGTLGLAIGLAVKDNLSNYASGVVLILTRPFTVGDYISVAGVSGTVQNVTLGNTILSTPDNQMILVPNNKITADVITNATANAIRRIDLVIGIGYGDDIAKAKDLLRGLLDAEPRILADPVYTVAVAELGDSSVNLVVRPWVKTGDYWDVRFQLTERIKLALDENGISIPFPQRDVHLISGEG